MKSISTIEAAQFVLSKLGVAPPFSNLDMSDLGVRVEEATWFQIYAWQYQVFIYREILLARYGELIAASVHNEIRQSLIVDHLMSKLEKIWEAIERGMNDARDNDQYITEKVVAVSLLCMRGSEPTEMAQLFAALTTLLVRARVAAQNTFSPLLENVTVEKPDAAGSA